MCHVWLHKEGGIAETLAVLTSACRRQRDCSPQQTHKIPSSFPSSQRPEERHREDRRWQPPGRGGGLEEPPRARRHDHQGWLALLLRAGQKETGDESRGLRQCRVWETVTTKQNLLATDLVSILVSKIYKEFLQLNSYK